MLVYLALARFRERPPFALLPLSLQRNIKSFFGTYSRACSQADELLFQAGNADLVDTACKRSSIGKLLPDSLYVHRTQSTIWNHFSASTRDGTILSRRDRWGERYQTSPVFGEALLSFLPRLRHGPASGLGSLLEALYAISTVGLS